MKWTGMYFLGFALLTVGLVLALWRLGVLATIGSFWTAVGLLALMGVGIMVAVMNGGRRTVEIDT